MDVGRLVTLDQIYDVQHTALDSDVQDSMARILSRCAALDNTDDSGDDGDLRLRAAKAVALLELLQEANIATTPELVAQCLYDHVDRGNQLSEVRDALDSLRRDNLLGYTAKLGYKIQSSAGEDWDRERRNMPAGPEARSEVVKECLEFLAGRPDRPRYQGRPFPWTSRYSDSYRTRDAPLVSSRDPAAICIDFQFLGARDARSSDEWIKKSAESTLAQRLIWVVGDTDQLEDQIRALVKSRAMVKKYEPRRESLLPARKLLLQQEQNNDEDLTVRARTAVESAFMAGAMYFAGRQLTPRDHGAASNTLWGPLPKQRRHMQILIRPRRRDFFFGDRVRHLSLLVPPKVAHELRRPRRLDRRAAGRKGGPIDCPSKMHASAWRRSPSSSSSSWARWWSGSVTSRDAGGSRVDSETTIHYVEAITCLPPQKQLMKTTISTLLLAAVAAVTLHGQAADTYVAPRTEWGQPDLQGV